MATIVVSLVKGHAAAESGERASAAAHGAAGGGQPLSTGAARLASRVFGSALAPVCNRVPSSADETTALARNGRKVPTMLAVWDAVGCKPDGLPEVAAAKVVS